MNCAGFAGYPFASSTACAHGSSNEHTSSARPSSASMTSASISSVAASIFAAGIRERTFGDVAPRLEALDSCVDLIGRPTAGADVAADVSSPIELGEEADLDGVAAGSDPRGDVVVATPLANVVADAP